MDLTGRLSVGRFVQGQRSLTRQFLRLTGSAVLIFGIGCLAPDRAHGFPKIGLGIGAALIGLLLLFSSKRAKWAGPEGHTEGHKGHALHS